MVAAAVSLSPCQVNTGRIDVEIDDDIGAIRRGVVRGVLAPVAGAAGGVALESGEDGFESAFAVWPVALPATVASDPDRPHAPKAPKENITTIPRASLQRSMTHTPFLQGGSCECGSLSQRALWVPAGVGLCGETFCEMRLGTVTGGVCPRAR
jgi:hypothetical protein